MTTQTPANAEMEKWLRIRVRFFTNFWLRMGVRTKNADSCGVDSGNPDPGPKEKRRILRESTPPVLNLVQACNKNNEDEWTQRTALSTIYKTNINSETFRWYCSRHPKCEINDADQHKRKTEEVFYKSAHGKWQMKEVLQNKRQI